MRNNKPGPNKAVPVAMHRNAQKRPCERCGAPSHVSATGRSRGYVICTDCRDVDPAFVKAIRTGTRVGETSDTDLQALLQDDLAERVAS